VVRSTLILTDKRLSGSFHFSIIKHWSN